MHRIAKAAPLMIAALNLLLPLGGALCRAFGLELDLILPRTIMTVEAALMAALTILRRRAGNSVSRCLIAELLAPALAAINTFCFTMAKNGLQQSSGSAESALLWQTLDVVWTVVLAVVILACALRFNHGFPRRIGAILLQIPLWGVPAFVCIVWLLMYLLLGNFGATYVGPELPSPDGAHVAAAIVHDEGALGGSACVEVRPSAQLYLGAAVIRKAPVQVYSGDWRPIEDMKVEWIDDSSLLVDGEICPLGSGKE